MMSCQKQQQQAWLNATVTLLQAPQWRVRSYKECVEVVWLQQIRCTTNHGNMQEVQERPSTKGGKKLLHHLRQKPPDEYDESQKPSKQLNNYCEFWTINSFQYLSYHQECHYGRDSPKYHEGLITLTVCVWTFLCVCVCVDLSVSVSLSVLIIVCSLHACCPDSLYLYSDSLGGVADLILLCFTVSHMYSKEYNVSTIFEFSCIVSEGKNDSESRLTSMLTGSMVLIWTLGAEDERSRWPNWLRWSSSLARKLGGMGMDLDGDTVVWHIDLKRFVCEN